MLKRTWLIGTAVVVAALLLLGKALAGVYVDYRWFDALGANEVWWARIENLLLLRGLSGLVATVFFFCNFYAVRHSVVSLVLPRRVANIEIGEEVPSRYLLLAVIGLSLLFGVLLAFPQDDWTSLALVRWGTPFRESDPYFEYDLGFWLYWLPFESDLHLWALIALLAATTVVVFLYALTPSLRWERGTLHVSGYVRRHLSLLGALLIFLLAWSYRLDGLGLLISGTGPGGAFTSADWKVGVPTNFVLAFATAAAAVLVGWAAWTGQMRIAFVAVTAVLVLSLGLRQFLPPLARRLAGPSDPEARESGYLTTRAGYTRRAYAVDRVVPTDTTGARIALSSIRADVHAISQWDAAAIRRAVERRRQGVVSGAVGWASDSGRLIGVVAQRPSGADAVDPFTPWTVTRTRAWASDERGGIVGVDGSGIEEGGAMPPALVYDSASGPLVVSDDDGDVAAPEISRWPSRLAHAWDQQNMRLMFSDVDTRAPRMMLHRDVRDRLRMLAPFFWQAAHITPISAGDSLYWAVHLYAASNFYPLSEHTRLGGEEVSYVRHAATAVIHSHTGRVVLVADSARDPLTDTWVRRFPSLFATWTALPAPVAANIPPPLESAVAQASAFARVGLRTEPAPVAHLPNTFAGDTLLAGAWRPAHLAPPDARVAWTTPLLDAGDRARGLVVAVGGPQPATYWYPLTEPGLRWPAVLERLARIPDSPPPARDVSIRRGPVRVVPLRGGAAAYLQTTYAWRSDGAPTVIRVAIHGTGITRDSVAVGATLGDAAGVPVPHPDSSDVSLTPERFRARVNELYSAMRDALRRADWAAFGKAYEDLGRVLRAAPQQ
ncbi:MAG TPA: UPF0182 family protein [Gemmatimonadaceae bacterium]|nr:UPF0182 family protein [Gemmatimonadaceae bacterium]